MLTGMAKMPYITRTHTVRDITIKATMKKMPTASTPTTIAMAKVPTSYAIPTPTQKITMSATST